MKSFWLDRPTLVTGGTGQVNGTALAKACQDDLRLELGIERTSLAHLYLHAGLYSFSIAGVQLLGYISQTTSDHECTMIVSHKDMVNWYALYTKPKSERQVERAFAAKGIETYFPYVLAPHRAGRSPIRPYFPCYLFAHVDIDRIGISQLNWVPGIRQVVCFAGTPARVDERVIAAIRQRLEEPLVLDEQGELMEHGDQVVITQGPFQDVNAIFDRRLSSAGRSAF